MKDILSVPQPSTNSSATTLKFPTLERYFFGLKPLKVLMIKSNSVLWKELFTIYTSRSIGQLISEDPKE